MFSFFVKKSRLKRPVFAGLVLFLLTCLLFVSCDLDGNNGKGNPEKAYVTTPMPEALLGTWAGPYPGEEYIITSTTFTASGAYAGTIEGHRSNGSGAGYIAIQYSDAEYYPNAAGNFYIVHYKDLTATTVSICGAYGEGSEFTTDGTGGKATKTAAEAAYTVTGGYFEWYSDCVNAEEER